MLGSDLITFLLNDEFVKYVQMPGINRKMHYLTEYTLFCFSLYYYYCQTYIAPSYIL